MSIEKRNTYSKTPENKANKFFYNTSYFIGGFRHYCPIFTKNMHFADIFSTAAASFSVKHKTIVPILRIIILRYRLAAFPPTINGTFCDKKSIFQAEISQKAAIKTRFVSCRRTVFFRLGGYPINCP